MIKKLFKKELGNFFKLKMKFHFKIDNEDFLREKKEIHSNFFRLYNKITIKIKNRILFKYIKIFHFSN